MPDETTPRTPPGLGRRGFLKAGAAAAGGLALVAGADGVVRAARADAPEPGGLAPGPFLRIGTDGRITVTAKHLEMGQGVYTGLATVLVDELDGDWAKVEVVGAPGDAARYGNLLFGGAQLTGGSSAMANSWTQHRQAGATARAMLLAAAAADLRVPVAELTVAKGVVTHARSRRRRTYAQLAARAATLDVPSDVPLKAPAQWTLIGREGVRRPDTRGKLVGAPLYTQDVRLPGMLVAVVAHPPTWGATVRRVDAAAARAVPGVVDVVEIPTGVAVLAANTWTALQGREALVVEWDETQAERRSSAQLFAEYHALLDRPGRVATDQGDADAALRGAATVVEATFEAPYLTHATLEPMNCVIRLRPEGGAELWYGAQGHSLDQPAVAAVLGCRPDQVHINTLIAGGSFGRRANPVSDYVVEAAHVARAIGARAPVKLVWTREDDQAAGWFRPMYVHRVRVGLDAQGRPQAWKHVIVGQSPMAFATGFGPPAPGADAASVEGASNLAYAIPNLRVENHVVEATVPVQWWRSVGHTHTAFVVEAMIDQLAEAAGMDAAAFRRAFLLKDRARHRAVLDLAVATSDWGRPLGPGRGRGLAVHESFNSVVAEVVEVTVQGTSIAVDRVTCAVDCGTVINPEVVRAQMEGGIGYALSAALHGEVTLDGGRVEQLNFHQYPPLRIDEMPRRVDVHLVPSGVPPTGVGEPGTPPLAAALVNAVYQATRQRIYRLPVRLEGTRA